MATDFRIRLGVMNTPEGKRVIVEMPEERLRVFYSLIAPEATLRDAPRFTIALWNSPDQKTLYGKISQEHDANLPAGKFNRNGDSSAFVLDRCSPNLFYADGVKTIKKVEVEKDDLREDGLYFSIPYEHTVAATVRPRDTAPRASGGGQITDFGRKLYEATRSDIPMITAEEAQKIMSRDIEEEPRPILSPAPVPRPAPAPTQPQTPVAPQRSDLLDFGSMTFDEAVSYVARHRDIVRRMVDKVNETFKEEGELTFSGEMTKVLIQKHISAI